MPYVMRNVEYDHVQRLVNPFQEHSGFFVCTEQPPDYPFAGDNFIVASYMTGTGQRLTVQDDVARIRELDRFLGNNSRNGFFLVQFHTHPVDASFSQGDFEEFRKSDHLLGYQPRYLFTPRQFYSARMVNGLYRIDHPEDLPNLIDEYHPAAQIIRSIKSLLVRELDLL